MGGKHMTAAERFAHYTPVGDGCWEWSGPRNADGYGQLWDGERLVAAHRYAFERLHGPLGSGLLACHSCDNPPCVRGDHIFAGTHQDNKNDSVAKGRASGRGVKGVANYNSRLTESAVREIRNSSGTCKAVGLVYGVSGSIICNIRARKAWRHVT